jgi:predicted nucleotidyltransferase
MQVQTVLYLSSTPRNGMMKKRDLKIAGELKKRLSRAVPLLDIRVFGSRARGDADEYSDMDVYIEVEHADNQTKRAVHEIVWEVGFKHSLLISPLIFSRHDIEDSPLRASPIVRNIHDEGVKV